MLVTFKDVGQGDSIIFEWNEDGKAKVGILDCSKNGGKNPVLNHIRNNNYKEIEFIILSHPHSDHYSGLPELLDYIQHNNLHVRLVAHTLEGTGKRYWKYFEVDRQDTKMLNKIIRDFKRLRQSGNIGIIDMLAKGTSVRMGSSGSLECLSPTHDEFEEYQRLVKLNADENIKEASKAANYLSTIFRLTIGESNFLFTSDAEIFAFRTIMNRGEYTFDEDRYVLCQLPHHGSENNHYPDFWKTVRFESKQSHAAISAGQHKSYAHPSFAVVEHFDKLGYVVNCTNIVNGMEQFTRLLALQTRHNRVLDGISVLAPEYRKANDRIYSLKDGQLKLLSNCQTA
jgi:beta-lactamase superfamily II metal-dependent hydrolase